MRSPRWVLSVSCLAAFLCASSASAQALKISQVFGGGGNPGAPFNRDYVELFNAGTSEVSLAGWSLQYSAAAGSSWQSTILPVRTIAPGAYFLVQMSAAGTAGEPLPTPDHNAVPAISMSSTSGKVALLRNSTGLTGVCPSSPQIIDLVGFGAAASCFEGSAPAPAPSNALVILRADLGCADTGQNSLDFVAGPANPRNSAIASPLCPGADLELLIEGPTVTNEEGVQVAMGQLTMENPETFTLRILNRGPDAATSITLTVNLPSNAAFIQSLPPADPPTDGVIIFPMGDLELDEEAVATVTLIPYAGTHVALSASVSALAPDTKPGNNSPTLTLPIFSFDRARLFTGVKSTAEVTADLRAVDVDSGASKPLISASVSGLAADNENRRFFISDGTQLSIVPWDTLTPIAVGTITGAESAVDGLAWHPSRRRLLGTTTSRLYEIDIHTAAAKLLRTFPAGDFGGIDYDVSSNRLIAVNNATATTGGLSGRGFYRIHPYDTELLFLFAFPERSPGVPETDIDGCAAGGGRFFGVTDQSEWVYRYQQSSSLFLTPLSQPLTVEHTDAGSTYAAEFYSQSPGANLGVQIAAPADCDAITEQPLTFNVTLTNHGPSYAVAPALTITLPPTATFIRSTPPLEPAANVLSMPLPGLARGESSMVSVTMIPSGASPHTIAATLFSSTPDALPLNNTAIRNLITQPALPAAPSATAVLSTLPGSNSVPGVSGLTFASADFGRLYRSPTGQRWILAATTSDTPSRDRVLIRGGGGTLQAVLQEGVTFIPQLGAPVGEFGLVYAVLDNGDFAFTTDTDPDPTFGTVAIKSIGGDFSVVAEQGGGNFAVGLTHTAAMGSVTLQTDGTISFSAGFGAGASAAQAFLTDDGQTLIARTPITIPTGQLAAPPVGLESFGGGTTEGLVTWMNAAGDKWCMRGDLSGPTATDICLVVDSAVRIQEGFRVPSSSLMSNVTGIHATDLEPVSGDVYCRGSNADGRDWVWRNGQVIASSTAPIAQGSTELFTDTVFARCFFLAAGNSSGDFIVGGHTSAADANANEVIVLNNQHVLLRENDPIDISGNGLLDNDARIHSFREHSALITDDGWLYAVVRVRSGASVCRGAPADIGQALIRRRVICPADFNRDGGANVPDIFAFLSAWFAQGPGADFDADGTVAVPDIFSFLSAWFAGC